MSPVAFFANLQAALERRRQTGMEKARKEGFELLLLGCAAFLLIGIAWGVLTSHPTVDFRPGYWSARTLLNGGDPYKPEDVLRTYHTDGGDRAGDPAADLVPIAHGQYPPSEFVFAVPFAALPFAVSQVLWTALIAGVVILAACLMWSVCAPHAPLAAGCLLGVFLINSPSMMVFANPGSIAVCLCAIGVWCILRDRFVSAGVICLAASLAIKPHDVGLVWLYFVLAGKPYRKRALFALVVAAAISLPAFLWISHVSPHWFSEMMANVQASRGRGGLNDPGPSSAGGRGIQMITDLQAVFSLVQDNPGFYNLASYIVCAPLLLLWAIGAIRSRAPQTGAGARAWFSLAAITALTMLPIYHRQYDAKLILLVAPAFSILLAEGGRMRKYAIWITAFAFVLNGDFTWLILIHFITKIPNANLAQFLLVAPVPLSLLAIGGFYLWAEMQRAKRPVQDANVVVPS
jgi:Glycosyltransferase family 87